MAETATVEREDCIAAATADDPVCKSEKTCLSHGMCLNNPVCRALMSIGHNAGFVQPTPSACKCGFGEHSFGGFICYCPTRWLLQRRQSGSAPKDDAHT